MRTISGMKVVKVYESLTPLTEEDLNEHIVRGQYTASGNKKGYREEKGVASESRTETYIAMKLGIITGVGAVSRSTFVPASKCRRR